MSHLPALDHANRAALLDDVEPARLAARRGDLNRLDEAPRDDDLAKRALGAQRGAGDGCEGDDRRGLPRRRVTSRIAATVADGC